MHNILHGYFTKLYLFFQSLYIPEFYLGVSYDFAKLCNLHMWEEIYSGMPLCSQKVGVYDLEIPQSNTAEEKIGNSYMTRQEK